MGNNNGNCYTKNILETKGESYTIEQKRFKEPLNIKMTLSRTLSEGTETYLTINRNKVIGVPVNGEIENGIIEYQNGDVYKGGIWKGKAHGKGAIAHIDGRNYQGRFANDMKEGEGILRFLNGNFYKGSFSKDQFDGKGVLCLSNDSIYHGKTVTSLEIWRKRSNSRLFQKWGQRWLRRTVLF